MHWLWHRFWEIMLGLDKGFLGREGELHWHFNPPWPFRQSIGAGVWNFALAAGAVALVWSVYRREGRSRPARILLGCMRGLLLTFLIILLNRPVVTLVE